MEQDHHDIRVTRLMSNMIEDQAYNVLPDDLKAHPYLESVYEVIDDVMMGRTMSEAVDRQDMDLHSPMHQAILTVAGNLLNN